MMLLAGGSMFAQPRLSIGIGFGGHGVGFYQQPPSYASNIPPCPGPDYTWVDGYWSQDYGRDTWVAGYWNRQPLNSGYEGARRFDNNFDDGDRRQGFTRGFEQDQNRGFYRGRDFNGQDRNQTRGFNQGRTRDFGNRNQNQNRGFGNQDQGWNRNGSNSRDDHQGNGYGNGFRGR